MMFRIALVAVVWLSVTARADAGFSLRLDDGAGNVVTVADGNGDGVIAFVGAVGGGVWTLNISVARSRPNVGSTTFPALRLTTTNVSSSGAGILTIMVSDTDFGPSEASMPTDLVSNSSDGNTGTVATSVYIDLANSAFNTATQIGSTLTGAGVYNVSQFEHATTDSNYSLNMVTVLTHASSQANTSQFDTSFNALPEPASMTLFGLGFAGLLGYRARRRRKEKSDALAA